MKSITPVVSVILLIMLTIVASAGAYFFITISVNDLQSGGAIEGSPYLDNSRLNLVSITGSQALVRNDGSSPVTEMVVLINGETLNYTLDTPIQPGEIRAINYTSQIAGQDLEIKVIYNKGKETLDISPADKNTFDGGFLLFFDLFEKNCTSQGYEWISGIIGGVNGSCCGNNGVYDNFYSGDIGNSSIFCVNGIYSPFNIDVNKSICDAFYPNSWMTGEITGTNSSCCGDDGINDNFSNGTHMCVEGVMSLIDYDLTESLCDESENYWFSGETFGTNNPCCGDDGASDNFYNGSIANASYFCYNGGILEQTIDNNKSLCSNYGYIWLENIENNSFADSGVYYKFDEGSGLTINDSNYGIAGNINGATWADGFNGTALRFSSWTWVELDMFNGPLNTTISVWIKPISSSDVEHLEGIVLSEQHDKGFGLDNGFIKIIPKPAYSQEYITTTQEVEYDVWQHIAIVYNTNNTGCSGFANISLYYNGELKESYFIQEGCVSGSRYNLGMDPLYGGTFNGIIDELYIFNSEVLSSSQINQLYNAGISNIVTSCCGDDGASDNFSNSTHSCCNGVFTQGSCV